MDTQTHVDIAEYGHILGAEPINVGTSAYSITLFVNLVNPQVPDVYKKYYAVSNQVISMEIDIRVYYF